MAGPSREAREAGQTQGVEAPAKRQRLSSKPNFKPLKPPRWPKETEFDGNFACKHCKFVVDGNTYEHQEDISIELSERAPTPMKYIAVFALPCKQCGKQLTFDKKAYGY